MKIKKYLQGEYREDGLRFVSFKKGIKINGAYQEQWLCPKSYNRYKIRMALSNAKQRSKKNNTPFDLDLNYLLSIFPEDNKCPILNVILEWNSIGRKHCPSLDKIDPKLGYIKGNVAWISLHANRLKDNATLEQLESIVEYVKQNTVLKRNA